MRQAPLGRVGQDPQRLVRAGQTQEQQEALAPELLTQQQDSGQPTESTHLFRSPPDCVANINAMSLRYGALADAAARARSPARL